MFGIFDTDTGALIEGGFFDREAAADAAREYQDEGRKVAVRAQRSGQRRAKVKCTYCNGTSRLYRTGWVNSEACPECK